MSEADFLPQEVIRALRDGHEPQPEDIARFIAGLTDGRVGEGQAAAFAMAVFFRGLSRAGRVALTHAMTESGRVLAWDLPGPVLDSIRRVAWAIASASASHRRSRLWRFRADDFRAWPRPYRRHPRQADSIPGYASQPGLDAFPQGPCARAGCAIIGQTADLAPAEPAPLRHPATLPPRSNRSI